MITGIISVATSIIEGLAVAGLTIEGLKTLGNALISLGKALGIIDDATDIEELGNKVIQAEEEGIVPEKYDNYDDYMNDIDDYDVDIEKSELITEEEKINKGIETVTAASIDKFPEVGLEEFFNLAGTNEEYFTKERMNALGEKITEGMDSVEHIVGFIDGSEKNLDVIDSAIKDMVDIEKRAYPELDDKQAEENVICQRN